MKTIRFLGIEIKCHFKINRVKRISVDIPDRAKDASVQSYILKGNNLLSDPIYLDNPRISYWNSKKVKMEYIDLPKCKRAEEISVSPLRDRVNGGYHKNRKIVIDLYLW